MLWTTLLISGSALMIGLVLARRIVRPIHVISSGLMRLRKGEKGVTIDLSQDEDEELKGLGESFSAIGEQLAAHSKIDALGRVETLVEELEEAVAILNPQGDLLFANSAMRATLPAIGVNEDTRNFFQRFPGNHPYRRLVSEAIKTRRDQGPVTMTVPGVDDDAKHERLITVHFIESSEQGSVGVMLVARNVAYLTNIRSTIEYARKLASLGRLMAGLTHEVKNPLNAMTIHLELVRQHLLTAAQEREASGEAWVPRTRAGSVLGLAAAGDSPTTVLSPTTEYDTHSQDQGLSRRGIDGAREHVEVIAGEIKRLDEVIQGFLRFIRPQELQLQIVDLQVLIREVLALVEPEVRRNGVICRTNQHDSLPELRADPALLRQALLNLALNGCQAMPNGGELTVTAAALRDGRMRLTVEDTGQGIPANQLGRIFDLYYTTKPGGSGIGLSMVFRIVQIHGGEIEVESVEGRGTSFRILLPQI
jgi:signal transduction histidine kinase